MFGLRLNEKGDKMKLKIITAAIFLVFICTQAAFSLQYTFQPRVSGTQEYTSNVFLSADNEEDDWITIVSAGFTAAALGKTGGLEVSYDPAYTRYEDFDENDGWRHDAKLHGWSDLGKRTRFDESCRKGTRLSAETEGPTIETTPERDCPISSAERIPSMPVLHTACCETIAPRKKTTTIIPRLWV
jgi:hypothetical protein